MDSFKIETIDHPYAKDKDNLELKNIMEPIVISSTPIEIKSLNEIETGKLLPEQHFTTKIDDLTPEMFQMILSYVYGARWSKLLPLRRVNTYWKNNIETYLKSFRTVIYNAFPENSMADLGNERRDINILILDQILSYFPNLSSFNLKNFRVKDIIIAAFCMRVPKITRLVLYGCPNLGWKGCLSLTNRLNLTHLEVSKCEMDETKMEIIVDRLVNLESFIAVSPGKCVTGNFLKYLGPKIKTVTIGFSHLKSIQEALVALAAGNGQRLISLEIIFNNLSTVDWLPI